MTCKPADFLHILRAVATRADELEGVRWPADLAAFESGPALRESLVVRELA